MMAARKRARHARETPRQAQRTDAAGETQHKLGMLLRSAYFALRRCSNAHCAALGANGDQFVLLKLLAEREGVTQQDLVLRGGYDATTTGSMLRLLERRGLVERKSDPRDGRAKRVHLTPQGRKLQIQLWSHAQRLREALESSVPTRQRTAFINTLNRIVQAMEQTRAQYEMETSERSRRSGRGPT